MATRETGLTLVELLVAVTVLALATVVALTLYDAARDSYKVGQNVTEQQQTIRIAVDEITSDLRMAGFNTNPDGNLNRPDEQIEAAYDRAVAIRADFDADDPVASSDPETTLSGGVFSAVSTGNDEIRVYALEKPGGAGGQTINFDVDVIPAVRDGTVETVQIDGLALAHDDPPYNLYRYTLSNDPGQYGGAGFVNKTVMAENVRSLRFHYFDQAGNELPAAGGGDTETARAARKRIHSVELELGVLTRDPDPDWEDPQDTHQATSRFRKFLLASRITPRNLGRRGIRDRAADNTPPIAPSQPHLYPGHCAGLYIDWDPSAAAEGVAYYRLHLGTDPFQLVEQRFTEQPGYYFGDLQDGESYYVSVQAVDESGNPSSLSPTATVTAENTNLPDAPSNVIVTDDQSGEIRLQWDAVIENTGLTTGDPDSPRIRDMAGYRVYRSTSSGFRPGPRFLIADETLLPGVQSPELRDTRVVHCERYYYLIEAVDRCGAPSDPSAELTATTVSVIPPKAPAGVEAGLQGENIGLQWSEVIEDTAGDPTFIEEYRIYRAGPLDETLPPPPPEQFALYENVTGVTEYVDPQVPPAGQTYWYRLKAADRCPNVSEFSEAAGLCEFTGVMTVEQPADGATITADGEVWVQMTGGGFYPAARLVFIREDDGTQYVGDSTHAGPRWGFRVGNVVTLSTGWHRLRIEVDEQVGLGEVCTQSTELRVYFQE